MFGQSSGATTFSFGASAPNAQQQQQQQQQNPTSLFGNTSAAGQSGTSLFAPKPLVTTPSAGTGGGSLFGNAGTSGSTSLFGGQQQQQQQTSKPAFSFGAPAASSGTGTTSLFGQPQQPATSTSGGLFGSTTTTSAPGATGGLFGAGNLTSQPQQSGGLFGQPQQQQQQQQQQQASGGLFGSKPAAGGLGGSLFGAKPAATTGGLFGQPAQPAPPALGASTTTNASVLTKLSKYNDLPDQVKSIIEGLDNGIRSQMQIADQVKAKKLGQAIEKASSLQEQVSGELTAVTNMLSYDSRQVSEIRQQLETDLADVSKVGMLLEGYKSPQTKGAAAKTVANFPYEYFRRKADELSERLAEYQRITSQIEERLSSSNGSGRNPAAIAPTLRAQNASFMSLASEVATLEQELSALRDSYRAIWRERTGSVQDPFKKERSVDSAVEALKIRS